MIEFCRIFHVEKPILANLGYLIFKLFWGSIPPDPPPEDLGPMVKIENTFILQWDPSPIQILIAPPLPLQILKHDFCGTFFKLYALTCYMRINSVPPAAKLSSLW